MRVQEKTILIVDDDQLHLKLYTWILQAQGYQCQSALVTNTSVELPTDAAIDLILLDYRLSSALSALDIIHKIKGVLSSVPIIVLSELQWLPDDMRGHVIDFVSKGDPERLIAAIASVLEK